MGLSHCEVYMKRTYNYNIKVRNEDLIEEFLMDQNAYSYYTIPTYVTIIGDRAFYGGAQNLTIPNTITYIGGDNVHS